MTAFNDLQRGNGGSEAIQMLANAKAIASKIGVDKSNWRNVSLYVVINRFLQCINMALPDTDCFRKLGEVKLTRPA